ncbi:MAG: FadD3 family acyl-CoA ligase [Myxococcales bacterium]|nr:FadD3 family acyl-CoA ligase [Myxococcales bacterium]
MQGVDIRWDEVTIPELARKAAESFGNDPAIEEGDRTLSFTDLADSALEASRAFLAAGIERGDRVAIWAPNLADWIIGALGLQSAGACLVTINTRFKPGEAAYVLRKAGARILLTVGDFLDTNYADAIAAEDLPALERIVTLTGSSPHAQSFADFLAAGARVPEAAALDRLAEVEPEDLSDLIFTSGTTGKPKGVMTSHGQNLKSADIWSRGVGLERGDRYLIVNPFFHSFGYKAGWLACLLRGATAIPHQVFDPPVVLDRVEREKITVLPGAPTLYQSLLAYPDRNEHDTSSLRLAVTGAAAIPVELVHRMRDDLGFRTVITAYGLTEASGTVTMCLQGDDAETIATTSGRAIPQTEVLCVDPDGKEVPRGEPGEVVTRGFHVMRGYFEDPAETAKAIDADGWLHTGDIGEMDAQGNLRITDRIKDMYICGGFNVYPAEVEGTLFEHEGIAQACVIGVPDERMGEIGMAFVVPLPGASLTAEAVIAWSRERMANYKAPRRVEIVDELPTTASGKVQKFVLRDRAAQAAG